MKKIAVFFILFFLVVSPTVWAGGKTSRVLIASGQTVHGIGGASVYILDLHSPAYESVIEGDFSAGFSGVTPAFIPSGTTEALVLSGATINVQFAEIFHLNLGVNRAAVSAGVLLDGSVVAAKLNWQNIPNMTNLAHDSGNTDYTYDFQPIKSPYLGIRIVSGATSMAYTLYSDMD